MCEHVAHIDIHGQSLVPIENGDVCAIRFVLIWTHEDFDAIGLSVSFDQELAAGIVTGFLFPPGEIHDIESSADAENIGL